MTGSGLPERPKIRDKCTLQREEDGPVLLYPEGLVQLNESGFRILDLTDGERTVEEIVRTLEKHHDEEDLGPEVRDFLAGLHEEGLLVDAGE